MANVAISGDTSGAVTLAAPAVAGTTTLTLPSGANGTISAQGVSTNIVSGTSQATTSGTAINYTSIPSWVKRITIMLNQVSTNGGSSIILQIGSGSYTASGYLGSTAYVFDAGTPGANNYSTGFLISNSVGSGNFFQGIATLSLLGSNLWTYSSLISRTDAAIIYMGAGCLPALSGALDRLRITMVNGTDAFDNGSINILYE